jgi:hypothetical protein
MATGQNFQLILNTKVYELGVCVTVRHEYNGVSSQQDATVSLY